MAIQLTDQQTAVCAWATKGTGHAILQARAGCGKTLTILELVKQLAALDFGNIFIGAYNKAIGDEIKAKLQRAGVDWRTAIAGTMHSAGFRAWRKVAPNVRIDEDKVAKILDARLRDQDKDTYTAFAKAAVSLAKQRAFGVLCGVEDRKAWYDLVDHFDLDSYLPEPNPVTGETLDTYLERAIEISIKCLRVSFNQDQEVIDYDDMILAPLVHSARLWKYDWVIIDEAQDTNPARRALAMAMLRPNGRMLAVGDDRQAIYGFTGADADSLDQIRIQKNAVVLPLNVTHRCPKAVVAVAQNWVPDIKAAPSAPEGTYRVIAEQATKAQREQGVKDFSDEQLQATDAILCRNTAPLVAKAFELLRNGIACKVEGRKIGEGLKRLARRWKIKTLTALENKLVGYLERETAKWQAKGKELKVQEVEDQVATMRALMAGTMNNGGSTIADLEAYIDNLFKDTREGDAPLLTLATIHRSKGREWKRVYWLGRNAYQPSKYARQPWQMHQEENLMYVAATRAMEELVEVNVAAR